jgi:hypothetical protein
MTHIAHFNSRCVEYLSFLSYFHREPPATLLDPTPTASPLKYDGLLVRELKVMCCFPFEVESHFLDGTT